jgi:monoamine oxidase
MEIPLMRLIFLSFLFIFATACKTTSTSRTLNRGGPETTCEVAIVGGGVAGLHTAFRLGPQLGDKVCVFEKESRLGGRIYDTTFRPEDTQGPYIAVGGRRVMESQHVLVDLAKELGLELQRPVAPKELVYTRGKFAFDKDEFLSVYPKLDVDRTKGGYEGQLYNKLLKGPERAKVDEYPNLKTYIQKVIGIEGYNFLLETFRFRADLEYDLSAKAYLEYLDAENEEGGVICPSGSCEALYPVGGMSAYVRAMAKRAQESGVRIFLEEPVLTVDKLGETYQLTSSKQTITANKLVLAIPPHALEKVGGSLAEKIKAMPEFKALIGIRVTTIAQWYDKPWWREAVAADGVSFWRGTTTKSCINSIEIPQEEYAAKQNVIRSVYNDKLSCVELWAKLAKQGIPAIEAEIAKGLEHLFANNGLTKPVKIPKPLKTAYWEWPDAWYYIRAGNKFSNADIFQWAVEPIPGEELALVSEAYNPLRSAWTDGAYKSSLHYLNRHWNWESKN